MDSTWRVAAVSLVLFTGFAAAVRAQDAPKLPSRHVSGVFKNRAGRPVEGVRVELTDYHDMDAKVVATTDAAGAFEADVRGKPKEVNVSATCKGYMPFGDIFGKEATKEFVLDGADEVRCVVLARFRGAPVAGAR